MTVRWFSRRAIGLHVTLAVVVPVFLMLCDWQVHRAVSGNSLSWAYAFEWPFFSGYAVYMWWKLVHEQPEPAPVGAGRRTVADGSGTREPAEGLQAVAAREPAEGLRTDAERREEEELAAYNRYLAELHTSGRRKHW